VDTQLARLVGALESTGALARTIVLATADHGESLGEHGEGTHGLFVYDATLKVPWIIAGPGVAAGRVPATVARGIDVLRRCSTTRASPCRPRSKGARCGPPSRAGR
jgi:arylsulfatase A-like enzyme